MKISIDVKELDALKYSVAFADFKCYTIPTVKLNIVEVVIKRQDGSDISNIDAYHLARLTVAKFERDHAYENARKLEQPSNTVIVVDPIDALP